MLGLVIQNSLGPACHSHDIWQWPRLQGEAEFNTVVGEIAALLRKAGASAQRPADSAGALLGLLAQLDPSCNPNPSPGPNPARPPAGPPLNGLLHQPVPAQPGAGLGAARNIKGQLLPVPVHPCAGSSAARGDPGSQAGRAGPPSDAKEGPHAHPAQSCDQGEEALAAGGKALAALRMGRLHVGSLLGSRRAASFTSGMAVEAPGAASAAHVDRPARGGFLSVRRSASESLEAPAPLANGHHAPPHPAARMDRTLAAAQAAVNGALGGSGCGEDIEDVGDVPWGTGGDGAPRPAGPKTTAAAVMVQAALNAMAAATPGADPLAVAPELLTPTSAAAAALVVQVRLCFSRETVIYECTTLGMFTCGSHGAGSLHLQSTCVLAVLMQVSGAVL